MNSIPKYYAGKTQEGAIALASNESNFGVSEKVKNTLCSIVSNIHKYPDSQQYELRSALAKHFGVHSDQLILGNGSDEVLSLIAQRLLNTGESTISAKETFSVYNIITAIRNAHYISIPLKDGYFDLNTIATHVDATQIKIIFLCNPNNPTGTCIKPNILKSFILNIPKSTYIVLDEAYLDFSDAEYQISISEKLLWHPNLIILRTFSKSFGLSGIRLGIGIAQLELAKTIDAIRMPFNINSFAQQAGIAALLDKKFYENTINLVKKERIIMMSAYQKLGLCPYMSQANFISFKVGEDEDSADIAFNFFAQHKIMIRSLKSFGLNKMVRITIGIPAENRKVLEILKLWLQEHKLI